ncbi:MAG: hypothetical protein IPM57_09255 [Oligoflexia bacterium]|nr:hypothetical protein [Oligoflexia bacterium]
MRLFMFKTTFFLLSILSVLTGCATSSDYEIPNVARPAGSLRDAVDKWSQTEKVYAGVMTSFQVSATMLTTEVLEQHIYREAINARRSTAQYQEARSRALIETQNQTQFMVTLFTDKEADNDLDKGRTLWNVFLDINGKRISPKHTKRLHENKAVLKEKYPYLSSWGKHYLVSFPVRVEEVQMLKSTLTIAGPLGAVYLPFPN